ncbi:MAG: hypothetical protein PW788_06880 [Micavibrio sp.]|nr:hypothetical protein [Micavibrio sp.]
MTLKSNAPLPDFPAPKSLREIFNREVHKAVEDFPELKGRFLFINLPDQQTVASIEPGRTAIRSQGQLQQIADDVSERAAQARSSLASKIPQLDLNVMAYTPLPFKMFTGKDQSNEMETMAVFDHELGHLVVGGAFFSKDACYRETAADAYAVIRHIQRYGDDSKAIEKAGWRRAFDFVMSGDRGHFTTLAIDEIATLRDKLDITAMTPDQTIKLAQRIALEHTPHFDATDTVSAAFRPVRQAMQGSGDIDVALKMLADIALASDNAYYTFKIGSRVLKPFLNGEVRSADGTPYKLEGQYWDNVRAEMAGKTQQLKEDGILFGMPLKGQPAEEKTAKVIPFPKPADPRFEQFKKKLL